MPPPNKPIVLDPDWRCWGCLCQMLPNDGEVVKPTRPFWQNICRDCWASLPLQWRLEFSARFTDVDKGGLGHAEVTREVLALAELLRPIQGDARLVFDKLREYLDREMGGWRE